MWLVAKLESPGIARKTHAATQDFLVLLIVAATFLVGLVSPPHLMDDVDAAEALQAKNMLLSGDWVTQHLNGTPYFDKAPLKYWITAALYKVFGIHDWVARLPTAVAAVLLCWLVVCMCRLASSQLAGFYSGLVLATSIGLFLFTRTIIPDIILTLLIGFSLYCFLRLFENASHSLQWALTMYSAMALAMLTKGLIGAVFPCAIALTYLGVTRQLINFETWRRLHLVPGISIFLVIAAPWHILAILHNPPLFDFTLHAGRHFAGKFRGFFWFYFINEQLFRFLNERWPRDFNTVPRLWFWLYHILWFFPWSLYLPAISRLSFRPADSASRLRLLAICWIGVVMLFFTFSTTQEYYSMPIYPAIAILLGFAMTTDSKWLKIGTRVSSVICLVAVLAIVVILGKVRNEPTQDDIYSALIQHPSFYTLSLGHMADLTLNAFAYLRLPLQVAAVALLSGGVAMLVLTKQRAYIAIALMMVLFFQAARLALIVFDPYLSSYAIAQKLNQLPPGVLLVCGKYNPLSSVFFYSKDHCLQNDADLDILEYGSLAPGAPRIQISDAEMKQLWRSPRQVYLVTKAPKLNHVEEVIGDPALIFRSSDKYLFANHKP
jgi:4-amino-4-deoxy-L-arabinose transferase-like glycosyltransferase